MRIRKKIDFPRLFLYLLFGAAAIFLYFVGDNGEPFSIALLYGMLSAGLSIIPSAILCFLPALFSKNVLLIFLYFGQALFVSCGGLWQRHIRHEGLKKSNLFSMLGLTFALGLYVALAPFTPYTLPFETRLTIGEWGQKVIAAALLFLIGAIFSVALKALLKKLLKCRLRNDEGIFSVFFLVLIGVGICRFLGFNAYMGIAIFLLLLFACATKDTSALVCAFCLSLPPLLVFHLSPEIFFLYGVAVTVLIKSGRIGAALAVLAVFFGYGYFQGLYEYKTAQLVATLLSVLIPVLLFVLIPTPIVRNLENRLIFYREKHLSRIAINRNRAAVGEKLFEISAVFREIQATFNALGASEAEASVREYIFTYVQDDVCKRCPQYADCAKRTLEPAFDTLIHVGCMKGKVSLIDIPKDLATVCINQSEILYSMNKQLGEYKNHVTEAENAASGRALLAGQAQGVSEILKNLALEQSEPLHLYTDKERALNIAFLSAGIVCSEVLVYGEEENLTLSLVTFGRADVKKLAAVASHILNHPMIISERIPLDQDKFACILRKKAYYDAAFGVATVQKDGANASGDTHSVIKLDERRFMVALSDGMGSGEYAKRISESTISLLESFYRAKMPSELVLTTINKLLTFSKEESFACVDVCMIDLDSGKTDIVKIGSPIAFILSGNTVKVLESHSLPLGILDNLHPDTASYTLAENDVLLFISDGISEAFGSAADLYEQLRSIPAHNPQELADTLLDTALKAHGGVAKDDMTAVAVRLFKSKA